MKSAYKAADGRKLEGRRVLIDVERGRTVPGWCVPLLQLDCMHCSTVAVLRTLATLSGRSAVDPLSVST